MLKVTMIIGEPCVGKSLLIREMMRLDTWTFVQKKYMNHHFCEERGAILLGDYTDPNQKYPGTDRLSMACQPKVLDWISELAPWGAEPRAKAVIFEGDRLGTTSAINELRYMHNNNRIDFEVIHVALRQEILDKRRSEVRFDQTEKFWWSRRTKINNMMDKVRYWRVKYIVRESVNLADTHNLVAYIRKNRI